MNAIATYLTDNLLAFDSAHPLLFTQFHFWAFFLLVYALFCLVASGRQWNATRRVLRNGYLFVVSLFFYYKTSGLFVLLLIFSTFLGYLLGWRMDALADRPQTQGRRKALMVTGVVLNLAVLCYFKYAYFFTDIYNTITHSDLQVVNLFAQWSNHFTATARFDASVIMLPVGISFFTFQNISYIVDVYRRKVRHVANVLDFGFYTSFFPQLVAGPIIRADQFVPQLYRPFFLSRRQFGIALFWIINGLFKKILLSDYLAVNFVDRVFDNPTLYTAFENFMALMVYSLQVYADFSGYTDIAIGVAMLMGFYLPVNFRSPYKATNPAGFWKRWHISLSNWLKDYLYIPLGGNRSAGWLSYFILALTLTVFALMAKSTVVWIVLGVVASAMVAAYLLLPNHRKEMGTNVNNMDTMLLVGLWHGASMNFVTWGGLNGLGILVYKWWKKLLPPQRMAVAAALACVAGLLPRVAPGPLSNMLATAGTIVAVALLLLNLLPTWRGADYKTSAFKQGLTTVWNTALTFVFISFTRLFFRSGSNLNPAEANEVAWRTATQMVGQIGSKWNWAQVPDILWAYRGVFALFVAGMVIHWLPEHFKRRYRLWFASMPLWLMLIVVVVAVMVIYQFVTADLQPFIYFQF